MNLNQASNYITTTAGLVAAGRQPEQPVCNYYGNVSNHHQNTAEEAVAGVYGYGGGGGELGRNVSIVEALDGDTMTTRRSRQMPRGGMAMMMMIGLGSATSGSSNSSISIDGGSGSGSSNSSNSSSGSNNSGSNSSNSSSRYESQKRRDWNTFGQYLRNHRPPLPLPRCSGAHVLEFLRYLDQFGKTKVHVGGCPYYGQPTPPPATCACPLRQAWGSLDALIGRLRAAFEENGGRPESNPFGARAVRLYLRHVRETQAKARGIAYEKKKRKRPPPPPPPPSLPSPSPSALVHASDSSGSHFWALPPPPPPPGFSPLPFPAAAGMPPRPHAARWHHPPPQPAAASWQPNAPPEGGGASSAWPFHMPAAAHSTGGGGNTALPPPPICSGSLDDLSLLETSNYCS